MSFTFLDQSESLIVERSPYLINSTAGAAIGGQTVEEEISINSFFLPHYPSPTGQHTVTHNWDIRYHQTSEQ